jgi:membrane-associated phospholipid phosphatase
MGTFIFCGLGSYLLLRDVRRWPTAGIIVMISLVWCLIMSFSRLYLGVHFASDVAAGLIAGGAWVAVCVSGLELLQQRVVTSPRQRVTDAIARGASPIVTRVSE